MRLSRFALVVLCCSMFNLAGSLAKADQVDTFLGPLPGPHPSAWHSKCLDQRWHVGLTKLPTLSARRADGLPVKATTAANSFWGCESDWPVAQVAGRNIWNELYRDPRCCSEDDPREAAFAARKAALVGGLTDNEQLRETVELDAVFLPESPVVEGSVARVARDYRHSVGIIESLRLNGDEQGVVQRGQVVRPMQQPIVANSNWLSSKEYPYEYEYEYQYGCRYNDRYRGDYCHDEFLVESRVDTTPTVAPPVPMIIYAEEIVRNDLLAVEASKVCDEPPGIGPAAEPMAAERIAADTRSITVSPAPSPRDLEQMRTMLNCSSRIFRCMGEAFRALSHELAERAEDLSEVPAVVAVPDKNGPKTNPVAATPGYGPLYIPAGLLGL